MTNERFFAFVEGTLPPQRTAHLMGAPSVIVDGDEGQQLLPRAAVVVLEHHPDGVFLYRYASDGSFGGDTWHPTVDEAREQAVFEYGDALGKWREIPPATEDGAAFALSQLSLQ